MKILVKVNQEFFETFRTKAIAEAPNDYYSRVGSRASSFYNQREARDSNREAEFIQCVIAVNNEKFPFNLYKSAENYTWHIAEYFPGYTRDDIIEGMDWSVYTRWGYHIDNARECYAYSTCAGNFYGVYKDAETGEFFAFASGARTVVADFINADEVIGEPLVYETSGPKDMKFWETQADYLIRKGELFTARYFAEKYYGVPSDYEVATQNEWDARGYFLRKNPNFDKLVLSHIFASPAKAEQFLLNLYRNKRFDASKLAEKALAAWNMLDEVVQARFIKYA